MLTKLKKKLAYKIISIIVVIVILPLILVAFLLNYFVVENMKYRVVDQYKYSMNFIKSGMEKLESDTFLEAQKMIQDQFRVLTFPSPMMS